MTASQPLPAIRAERCVIYCLTCGRSTTAAKRGEELFDLRHRGPFKGKGTIQQRVEEGLRAVWQSGNADTVSAAMAEFRAANDADLLAHAPVPKTDQTNYRSWLRRFAKWLYSTNHISLRYGVDYGGVDIRKLSPGTRGIVLLLLYLALDDADDRPLIIDQPEENLDPKSIFDELVDLFLVAKNKRQVIMVTHNANLVINTDADQIIIAEAGAAQADQLPPMSYTTGGLESAPIRKAVCDILEGGEHAFKERARRLRVRLQR
jgi:predicted ATPase